MMHKKINLMQRDRCIFQQSRGIWSNFKSWTLEAGKQIRFWINLL